jgi:hypothetical protein
MLGNVENVARKKVIFMFRASSFDVINQEGKYRRRGKCTKQKKMRK